MTNQEVANRLVSLLKEGKFMDVYNELFHENAQHNEPQSENFPHLKSRQAIIEKDEAMSEHIAGAGGLEVGDAIVSKSYIAIPFKMTVELKDGNKMPMDEIIVYKVENGKILSEQFFY